MGDVYFVSQLGNLLNIHDLAKPDLALWTVSDDFYPEKPLDWIFSTNSILLLELADHFIHLFLSASSVHSDNVVNIEEDYEPISNVATGFMQDLFIAVLGEYLCEFSLLQWL